ncbi:MAG: hypothetical protein ACI8V2_003817 [Candidatus Latescibacterota bacterium]|jgi:hypothetical protein
MEIFLLFLFFATLILGILCLTVLEYQNQRSKKWLQTLPGRITPTSPSQHNPPTQIPSQEKALSPTPAQVA